MWAYFLELLSSRSEFSNTVSIVVNWISTGDLWIWTNRRSKRDTPNCFKSCPPNYFSRTHETPDIHNNNLYTGQICNQEYRTWRGGKETVKLSEELCSDIYHEYKIIIEARQQADADVFSSKRRAGGVCPGARITLWCVHPLRSSRLKT